MTRALFLLAFLSLGGAFGKPLRAHAPALGLARMAPADRPETFALGAGQCGVLAFSSSRPAACDGRRIVCRLYVPRGFVFLDASAADPASTVVAPAPDGGTDVSFRFRVPDAAPAACGGAGEWGVLLRADAPLWTRGELTAALDCDVAAADDLEAAPRASEPVRVTLETHPAARARAPKRYANGIFPHPGACTFPTARGNRAFAALLRDMGVTWIVPDMAAIRDDPSLVPLWRAHGIRRITPDISPLIANGYQSALLPPGEGERFVTSDENVTVPSVTWCPSAILATNGTFATRFTPMLAQALAGCDGAWSNWEPYELRRKGCFCARCRARFAACAGLAASDLDAGWPFELLPGGKWYEAGRRFRSAEHARVVGSIARATAAVTGTGGTGFIPGIYWPDVAPGGDTRWYCSEARAAEYLPSLAWLNPFGPYVHRRPDETPEEGQALVSFSVAEAVRRTCDGKAPHVKLLAFPLGYFTPDWQLRPEWLELSLAAFFFNRWDAAVPWRFPAGLDARYLRALAAANTLAATWEDALAAARPDPAIRVRADAWCARTRAAPNARYLPGARDVPLLRCTGYDLGDRILAAVFNFSETQAVDFTLEAPSAGAPRHLSLGPCRHRVWTFAK